MMEPAPIGSTTGPARSRTAFVGRRAEIERLETVWAAVEDDRRQVVFVGGEPGVGKTRLVVEVAAALREHGATVLWGACREEFNTPYRPFVAILEQALEQVPPEVLRDITPQAAAPLLRLTTAALRPWPAAASLASDDGDSRPILFDAVLRVLLAAAEQKPTVLVLEDLHWAPEPTLAMLSHLVESTAGEQILVLATRRTTAPDRTDTVSFALADLHRLEGVARIDLVGLATEDVAEYLVREAGVSLSAARAAAPVLRDHTGGNPFFLQEYWHELASRGGLAAVRSGSAHAPGSVQDALARRLAAFDIAHAQVLELAAVAGNVVDPGLLVEACDLGPDAVLEGIDLAVRAGLLVADVGDGGYRFAHSLARQAVLDQMTATDLAAAHARVAGVLERHMGEDDPGLVAQLAHHYVQARALGHGDRAVHYLVLAAQQAVRGIAHSEAAALYERAAQLHVAQVHRRSSCSPPRPAATCTPATSRPRGRSTRTWPRTRTPGSGCWPRSVTRTRRGGRPRTVSDRWRCSARHCAPPRSILTIPCASGPSPAWGGRPRSPVTASRPASSGRRRSSRPAPAVTRELTAHALTATLWQGLTPELAPRLLARALELHEIGSRLGDDDLLGPGCLSPRWIRLHRGRRARLEQRST